MNDVIKTLLNRRSIRRYLKDAIPQEKLDTILKAASWSPSSMNSQPWHFTVIHNQIILDEISRIANKIRVETGMIDEILDVDADSPDAHVFYKAPTVIVVSGRDDTLSPNPNVDCALAAFSAFVAATSLGLGACIVDLYNSFGTIEDAHEMLDLSSNYMPYYGVVLGYRDENFPVMVPARKTDNITYFE